MSEPLTNEQTAEVVYALLKVGLPPTGIAKGMGMDPEHVTAARSQMLVERLGTDEKAEMADWLIWEALEEAQYQIRHGTPANKARFMQIVLARSIGIAGKSSPETSEKIRQAFAEMAADLKPNVQMEPSIYTED